MNRAYESWVTTAYPGADKHPGWDVFMKQLKKTATRYGYNMSEVREAWYWFSKGWDEE